MSLLIHFLNCFFSLQYELLILRQEEIAPVFCRCRQGLFWPHYTWGVKKNKQPLRIPPLTSLSLSLLCLISSRKESLKKPGNAQESLFHLLGLPCSNNLCQQQNPSKIAWGLNFKPTLCECLVYESVHVKGCLSVFMCMREREISHIGKRS